MLDARSQPWTRIGVVDQGADDVSVQDQFSIPLSELRQVHGATLPALFGEGLHSVWGGPGLGSRWFRPRGTSTRSSTLTALRLR